jgi:hypothetical protein
VNTIDLLRRGSRVLVVSADAESRGDGETPGSVQLVTETMRSARRLPGRGIIERDTPCALRTFRAVAPEDLLGLANALPGEAFRERTN